MIDCAAVVLLNTTVPAPGVNVPPLFVQSPATLIVAAVPAENVPDVSVNPPFSVSVVVLPAFYRNTGEHPPLLVEYWKKKYPALAALRLTGNPTEEERRILATEGAALVQELTRWINAGGNYDEHN